MRHRRDAEQTPLPALIRTPPASESACLRDSMDCGCSGPRGKTW